MKLMEKVKGWTVLLAIPVFFMLLGGGVTKIFFPRVKQLTQEVKVTQEKVRTVYIDTCSVTIDSFAVYQEVKKSLKKKVVIVRNPTPSVSKDTIVKVVETEVPIVKNTYDLPFDDGLLRGVTHIETLGELTKLTREYELDTLVLKQQFQKTIVVQNTTAEPPIVLKEISNQVFLEGQVGNPFDYGIGLRLKTKYDVQVGFISSLKKVGNGSFSVSLPLFKYKKGGIK